jgi:hypothetical protein
MKDKTYVTIAQGESGFHEESTSTHIFNTKEEAHRFISWIQNYNADLNITIEEPNNEDTNNTNESGTFI